MGYRFIQQLRVGRVKTLKQSLALLGPRSTSLPSPPAEMFFSPNENTRGSLKSLQEMSALSDTARGVTRLRDGVVAGGW